MENLDEAMILRHSVRNYEDTPLSEEQIKNLQNYIQKVNDVSGLSISLHVEEDIFSHWILGYGFIKNCHNYLRFAGKDTPDLEEKVGYYGELVILKAQQFGLNTCWVGGTYRKKDVVEEQDTKLVCVAALGVGKTQGNPSKSKPIESYYQGENVPDWFIAGMKAVMLAPSAVNQKKWLFRYLDDGRVEASSDGKHFNAVDLGIAKLHFELGAKRKVFGFSEVE